MDTTNGSGSPGACSPARIHVCIAQSVPAGPPQVVTTQHPMLPHWAAQVVERCGASTLPWIGSFKCFWRPNADLQSPWTPLSVLGGAVCCSPVLRLQVFLFSSPVNRCPSTPTSVHCITLPASNCKRPKRKTTEEHPPRPPRYTTPGPPASQHNVSPPVSILDVELTGVLDFGLFYTTHTCP